MYLDTDSLRKTITNEGTGFIHAVDILPDSFTPRVKATFKYKRQLFNKGYIIHLFSLSVIDGR